MLALLGFSKVINHGCVGLSHLPVSRWLTSSLTAIVWLLMAMPNPSPSRTWKPYCRAGTALAPSGSVISSPRPTICSGMAPAVMYRAMPLTRARADTMPPMPDPVAVSSSSASMSMPACMGLRPFCTCSRCGRKMSMAMKGKPEKKADLRRLVNYGSIHITHLRLGNGRGGDDIVLEKSSQYYQAGCSLRHDARREERQQVLVGRTPVDVPLPQGKGGEAHAADDQVRDDDGAVPAVVHTAGLEGEDERDAAAEECRDAEEVDALEGAPRARERSSVDGEDEDDDDEAHDSGRKTRKQTDTKAQNVSFWSTGGRGEEFG